MSTDTKASVTTQVYEVYIKATPQAIWDAITSPEWTVKYGYQGAVEYELRPGGAYRAHATPDMRTVRPARRRRRRRGRAKPTRRRKLVHTYRFLFSDADEGRGLHARHVGDREGRRRLLAAHRDPRARGRADHGRHGGQQVLRAGRGWLGLDSQRHEVAARDRELDVNLDAVYRSDSSRPRPCTSSARAADEPLEYRTAARREAVAHLETLGETKLFQAPDATFEQRNVRVDLPREHARNDCGLTRDELQVTLSSTVPGPRRRSSPASWRWPRSQSAKARRLAERCVGRRRRGAARSAEASPPPRSTPAIRQVPCPVRRTSSGVMSPSSTIVTRSRQSTPDRRTQRRTVDGRRPPPTPEARASHGPRQSLAICPGETAS